MTLWVVPGSFSNSAHVSWFAPFKWKHFEGEIILWGVRWYCRYAISYRNLQEMMVERGLKVSHTTLYRWVQEYAPKIDKKARQYLRRCSASYRVDETYVKIKGDWYYLYRAVDKQGNILEFLLTKSRDKKAAKRFFKKMLGNKHIPRPRVINVDKDKAYPPAVEELKKEKLIAKRCKLRQVKYLNNIVEQAHR